MSFNHDRATIWSNRLNRRGWVILENLFGGFIDSYPENHPLRNRIENGYDKIEIRFHYENSEYQWKEHVKQDKKDVEDFRIRTSVLLNFARCMPNNMRVFEAAKRFHQELWEWK